VRTVWAVVFSTIKSDSVEDFTNNELSWKLLVADVAIVSTDDINIRHVQAASIRVTTEVQANSRSEADEISRRLMAACNSTNEAWQPDLGQCEYPFKISTRPVAAPSPPTPPSAPPPSSLPDASNTMIIAVCLSIGLLLLLLLLYICWRRSIFARCGMPYKPLGEHFLTSALNVRLYTSKGSTPTRLDSECNFNAPAKGSFAVSRLGIVRDAPTREQRRRISVAVNRERYKAYAAAGTKALRISSSSIEPNAGLYDKHSGRRGLSFSARSDSCSTPRRFTLFGVLGTSATATESNSESSHSDYSPGRKKAMSIEDKAATEVRQQAIAYSQRARLRSREERKSTRASPRGHAESAPTSPIKADLEHKPSFMNAQRQLLVDLKKIDSTVDVERILGEEKTPPPGFIEYSPRQEAHTWLSRVMAETLAMEGEQERKGDPQKALARARGSPRSSPRGSPRSSPRGSPRSSPRGSPRGSPRVADGRAEKLARARLAKTSAPSTLVQMGNPDDLFHAAAASYAQNHRLNSRVTGCNGLDASTSAHSEARTLNMPLSPGPWDSMSRIRAEGVPVWEDPTKLAAQRELEGMVADVAEIERPLSSRRLSPAKATPVTDSTAEPPATPDNYLVDMDRVTAAASNAGAAFTFG